MLLDCSGSSEAKIGERAIPDPYVSRMEAPIWLTLLGSFRLLKLGREVSLRVGGKPQMLLSSLAVRHGEGVRRDHLLCMLWPDSDGALATQSLNNLIYTIHKQFGDALRGSAIVLHEAGRYRLNTAAGVEVDVMRFDHLARAGDEYRRLGQDAKASVAYGRAVELYGGDLCEDAGDVHMAIERERLRARYLMMLSILASDAFRRHDYEISFGYLDRLLQTDPCREDAHRQTMRCLVRLGERGRALRQFRLCETILREEFDAVPEPATRELFDRVRLDPASV
jgi:DNA-binding SARP family transcriptional activator